MTVGFVMVGSANDAGYNQAVAEAADKMGQDLGVHVLKAEQIPENANVAQTMDAMVKEGATVIFATSYGYFSYALQFAQEHPDVIVLHQGGYQDGEFPPNFGTYFGQTYDTMSLAGMAAAAASKTGQLGFIYALPIPATLGNINAFQLGAERVNPNATTHVIATSAWCDPVKQQAAVSSLVSLGVDVIANHQDCQSTIIQSAKSAGVKIIGFHHDSSALYPGGWLTGAVWDWTPVYEGIVKSVIDGTFTGSKYNANWFGSYADGNNPMSLTDLGAAVPDSVKSEIETWKAKLSEPNASSFVGPLSCQDGSVLVAAGEVAGPGVVNSSFKCLMAGVQGELTWGN
jgi:simple sugar transport system substrate-binding protein/basic membrane protein A